MEVLDLHKVL